LLRPFRIILQATEFSLLRKTKIIATPGPATEFAGMIVRLMDAVPMRVV
jgi:pyruvate kinase